MGLAMPPFVAGNTVLASDVGSRVEDVETFINEGIAQPDIQTAAWVKMQHVFKPEFYGSPAPRCHAVSADTHYRYRSFDVQSRSMHHIETFGGGFVNIPGLCATVKIPEDNVPVDVMAAWYAWQFGGLGSTQEDEQCAEFRLFVDGSAVIATRSALYTNNAANQIYARKQMSIATQLFLNKGIHHVGIRINVFEPTSTQKKDWFHIFIDPRTLVIDAQVR
jgi:hypothetical protein